MTLLKLEDIKNEFGSDVAKFVDEVSEDKSLPWKERKIEAIDKIKTASLEGKLVECADKINNLETLYNQYQEQGESIWKSFNKPKEEQKWYYTKMYEAVLMNTNEKEALFERYKRILEKLF